jgi:serine/threonine protein kinase/tetratricopeptide (TPR) repeat protein
METQIISGPTEVITNKNAEYASDAALSGGMLRPGEEVGGYRVDRLIATSGGEAEVYLCTKCDENFVLKYYYTKKSNREAEEKIKSFSHENIISILDCGEYNGRFFTILEYASGGALDDKLPDGSYKYLPVSENEAQQIVRETVNAFEACHKAGIIHRDIKPGNLFYKNQEVLPNGKYKGSRLLVGDFGIASVFEVDAGMSKHMTETGAKTEGYAAPEAYSGVIGKEYDYYSLGVTLWVLLTGMEPFINDKGQALYSGQITLDTIQGKTIDNLLSRSPKISVSMQKLIRGLLTVRHDKRWKYDEVTRHLAGENVELFTEVRTLPSVEIGGENCSSYQEIARTIINHPEEGKNFIFKGRLLNYLVKIDQKLVDRLIDMIDSYSAENREDEGAVFIAYSLCPNMAFPLEHGLSISSLEEMFTVLNTDPDAILPFLRDERKGFYAYLEVSGLGEHGKKVKEIINATTGDIKAVSRIIATFQGNVIKPFQDGINNEYPLVSLEDMYNLPGYLKERVMIFIERNYGLLPAWIENLTGKNLDTWLSLLSEKKDRIARWGAWEYFILFMQDLESYDRIQKNGDFILYEKNGKKGLYRIALNSNHAELLYGVEVDGNRLTLKKKDGGVALSGTYAVNFADGYDGGGVSTLSFLDGENKMAVFDGSQLYYFNINSSLKEPRHELKDGEINLLLKLGSAVPAIDLAHSFKEKNNFTDMNKFIDAFWKKFGEERKFDTARDLLLFIDKEKMDGLPYSFDFYISEIGSLYFCENSYDKALTYFEEALSINPSGIGSTGQSYNYSYGLSLCLEETSEDWDKAIDYLDKAMEITPDMPQPVAMKGNCLHNLNKYNEAIACLNMALDKKSGLLSNAEKGIVLKTRAMCWNALGMKDKADKDSTEADRLAKLPN